MTLLRCAVLILALAPALTLAEEPLRNVIDREVLKALQEQKIEPVGLADDATFLRRVYLDIAGVPPNYATAREFLDDPDPAKREKLVEQLLAGERYANHQADQWDVLLFTRDPANPSATRKRERFRAWLEEQFAQNVAYDELARRILLAEEDDASMFHVQWRNQPEDETESFSRVFLGTQLGCARCHDHPFEDLTQEDFYGIAGFFVRLVVLQEKQGKETIYRMGEKSSGEVLFTGAVKDQKPGQKGVPVRPRFLGGDHLDEPELPEGFEEPDYKKAKDTLPDPYFSRIGRLTDWLTSPENPYFARAAVNRIWAQFMGRGLVHPVDNLKPDSVASHQQLLDELTRQFVQHEFDQRWLIRELVLSESYQRDDAGPSDEASLKWYQRARVRPLSYEELVDSLRVATGFDNANETDAKLPGSMAEYMIKIFGESADGRGDFQGGIHEHLFLNFSSQLRGLIRPKEGNLTQVLLASEAPWEERVDRLYLSTLTRLPSDAEREKFVDYITTAAEPDQRLEDAIWTLLNSSQFRFNY